MDTTVTSAKTNLTDYYEKGPSLAIDSTDISVRGTSSTEKHRLKLIGCIAHAAQCMTSELLRRTKVEQRGASVPVALKDNAKLYYRLRDELNESICAQFMDDPSLREVFYTPSGSTSTPLQRIIDEAQLYDDVYWPFQFEIRIVRDNGCLRVSYNDWSLHNDTVVVYEANLLLRPASS